MSGSTPEVDANGRPNPVFASIGTVLVDCFDLPPLPSLATQTPAPTRPASPTSRPVPSALSAISLSSLFPRTRSSGTPGTLTPQRSFSSDDTSPSSGSTSGQSTASGLSSLTSVSSSLAQIDEEPVEVLGGGALYCLIGARMWLPPSECIALVDTDEDRRDLSKDQEDELAVYGAGCWGFMEGNGRRMIKARIRYEGTARLYKHIVPALPRNFSSLLDTPIDGAQYLHVAPPYNPDDLCRLLAQQRALEAESGEPTWRPKIVYEPAPLGCHLGQKESLEELLPYLEVISPNHEELLSLYGQPLFSLSSPLLVPALEGIIDHMLDLGVGENGKGSVVVRCGRMGCVVGTRSRGIKWFPAYWEEEDESRVKDVTGGGNAYLGGFIAGLAASGGDAYEAALYGSVSASFTVEQIGLPLISASKSEKIAGSWRPGKENARAEVELRFNGRDGSQGEEAQPRCQVGVQRTRSSSGGELRRPDIAGERWNGEVPEYRLEVFRRKCADLELAGLEDENGRSLKE